MSYFYFIRELRKAEPDRAKTRKAMKIMGTVCVFIAIWNLLIYYIAPIEKLPVKLPPSYPYIAFAALMVLGALFFTAQRGIGEGEPWGKKLGQFSILLLTVLIVGSFFLFMPFEEFKVMEGLSFIPVVIFVLVLGQFILPAYLGIRYLERLPLKANGGMSYPGAYKDLHMTLSPEKSTGLTGESYSHSPLPFGLLTTFILLIAGTVLTAMLMQKLAGPEATTAVIIPMFLIIFVGSPAFNYVASPFEEKRRVISSYTGGGSINMFNGTWPFFRVLLYEDGLEVRVMFQRYFIPYDKMENPPEKVGFFSHGLLIASNLPNVPSTIRLHMWGMKKLVRVLNETRSRYLGELKGE